ncbi:hypothetical protein BDP55DRAFT_631595 [Colletotrichum godetiae]|uniref:BTB domain-containing protein n=2 Tax=Colletotrichum acutatum species complex TaxID=2707335 RepID=A0A135USI0_9PEZI|nr:uncharacterized protein BDP55DRAFT_631595 [Colletotrichum godetiae]KAK1675890.1 hypothetical protein BDP55DRAFT_631595 [Colletotrichum godetiae]KXH63349.1 hypothetical protein CSAL01_13433 [Colletotrichum salicis]
MSLFKRTFRSQDPNVRVDKTSRLKKSSSIRDHQKVSKMQQSVNEKPAMAPPAVPAPLPTKTGKSVAPSPIVTLTVGREGRLFAAHEDVLFQSPFFEAACRGQFFESQSKRISLPDEEPEIFSSVLEYLYKGDYYPRLVHNRHRNSWELEDAVRGTPQTSPNPENTPRGGRAAAVPSTPTSTTTGTTASEATIFVSGCGQHILRDTVIYCAAERYGLEELKRLALRKQGLQSGIDIGTILRSAQYAYAHTPDSDSRLRAHYLALIIRCRKTFKRSGTMQAEMERGGSKLFFDLFVAMCNHLDDVIDHSNARTPKTV